MDQETLYTATKWDILKHLESGPKSPIELSNLINMSLGNISQQLRLLELAGIVISKRVRNRNKGEPRVLYEISGNSCYIISTSNNFVQKKRLTFNINHQIILKIWFLENSELRTFAEKGFWKIEEHLQDIKKLYLDVNSTNPISFYIVPKNDLNNSLKSLFIKGIQNITSNSITKQLTITPITEEKANNSNLYKLYSDDI